MEAADVAGRAFCMAYGMFDASGALVNGTEGWVRSPTGWNGTGQPDVIDVDYAYWRLPDEGKPAVCSTWNGKEWVAGKTEWPGTVTTPVALDPMEVQVREWGRSWCVPQHVCATLQGGSCDSVAQLALAPLLHASPSTGTLPCRRRHMWRVSVPTCHPPKPP